MRLEELRLFTSSSQQQQIEKDLGKDSGKKEEGKETEAERKKEEGKMKEEGEKRENDSPVSEKDGKTNDKKENDVKDERKSNQRNPPDLGRFLNTFTIVMGLWILFTILSQRTSVVECEMD